MRPPHKAGDNRKDTALTPLLRRASMRPPHKAGDNDSAFAGTLKNASSFNEAPAQGGG